RHTRHLDAVAYDPVELVRAPRASRMSEVRGRGREPQCKRLGCHTGGGVELDPVRAVQRQATIHERGIVQWRNVDTARMRLHGTAHTGVEEKISGSVVLLR